MADDKDSVQLSEYCFNVCEVLKAVVRGRNGDSLNESVVAALEDLEKCVDRPWFSLLSYQATPGLHTKSSGLLRGEQTCHGLKITRAESRDASPRPRRHLTPSTHRVDPSTKPSL